MATLWKNLKYGTRLLFKAPALTGVIVLSLGLGIGAATTLFSLIYGVLLNPLSFKQPNELVRIWTSNPAQGFPRFSVSPLDFLDWQSQNRVFQGVAAYSWNSYALSGNREPEQLDGADVTHNIFSVLGVAPILGRSFTAEETIPGKNNVAVISYGLFQRVFGSDGKILGRTVRLDGNTVTIVGIMPRNFSFPSSEAEIWTPLVFDEDALSSRGAKWLAVIARLKTGTDLQQATTNMKSVAAALSSQYPDSNKGWSVAMVSLQDSVIGKTRKPLMILFASVALVLLIACSNVASLLMAQNSTRRSEVAIRSALGANRKQLIGQFLTESILFSLLGGALGLLLAVWGKDAVLTLAASTLPRANEIAINLPVLLFALVISLLTGIFFGLLPAFQATATSRNGLQALQTRGIARSGVRQILVVSEVALALVLLAGAGLLIRSLDRLISVSPGFDPQNVTKFHLHLPESRYPDDGATAVFEKRFLEDLSRIPGVEYAGITNVLPISGGNWSISFDIKGRELPKQDQPGAEYRVVSKDYFRAMKIPLVSGRYFSEQDRQGAPAVAIINQAMAREFWPGQDPLGQQIQIFDGTKTGIFRQIIGVVGNTKQFELASETKPEMYIFLTQQPIHYITAVVRSSNPSMNLIPAIRKTVHNLDPELPLYEVSSMKEILSDSLSAQKFSAYLLSLFAMAALLLALVGLYGILSYSVSQRTQEIGIRLAVGANTRDVLRMILSSGFRLTLYGISIGFAGILSITKVLESMLFEVKPTDPLTLATVVLLLIVVSLLAVSLPAYRAAKVDPLQALRYE